jgi:hypothetical protein
VTVMNQQHQRVILPRLEPDNVWSTLDANYARGDARRWKYLAMLALRENCGWTFEQIGTAFGHPRGHVSRCLRAVKEELRSRFELPAGKLSADEGFSNPHAESAPDGEAAAWDVDDVFTD